MLGIEVDNGISRVVEMEFKAKVPKLYHAFTIASPIDLLSEDGIVQESEAFRQAFRDALKRLHISTDRVAFSVSSSRIINREITIPMVRESKIETLIYQNAADYFPVNITDYKLVYNILGKLDQNGRKAYKLLVCAVPRDIIRSYYQFASFLGVDVAAIDFAGNGIFQALKASAKEAIRDSSDKTELYLSVNSDNTLLTFVREGTICLQRIVSVGLAGLMIDLMQEESDGEDIPAFDRLLRDTEEQLFSRTLRRNASEGEMGAKERRTEALRPLILAIRRSIEYYLSSKDTGRIEVYLAGGICLYRGFGELLGAELDLPVLHLETALEKRFAEIGDGFPFTAAEFLAPIGACTQPINLANRQHAKTVSAADVFHDPSVQNTILSIGIVCLAICAAISAALIFMSDSEQASLEKQETQLREELLALGDTTSAKSAYNTALYAYNSLHDSIGTIDRYLETYNDHFVSFMEEMERKMPSSFRAVGLTVSETGVVLNICVDTENEAAYVIQTFRNCASVKVNSISNISITQNSQVVGYNIDALLDQNGHLIRDNLASAYAGYSQEELDALIPALQNGTLSPAEVYATYTAVTTISYSIDQTVMSLLEVYKQLSDNPLVAYADTMMEALMDYLNREQIEDLSILENFTFVNSTIFPLSDYGITEEQYAGYVEQMRSMGYDWDTIFVRKTHTTYEENGSGIMLPEETISSDILSFTISLTYTGQFEDMSSSVPTQS